MEQAAAPEARRQLKQYACDLIDRGFWFWERARRIYPDQLILDQHIIKHLTMTAKAFPRKKRPYMFAMTPTANALYAR